MESKDIVFSRKIQKADREKLRRDRLNEQFIELGNELDPGRPNNCKATILADAIQTLKDLTAQVEKLKSEYSVLTEESRELTEEKHDLKEEKASLKLEIESLGGQYQQGMGCMQPWPPVMMGPSSYPVPSPAVPMPPFPIPMHPYPFFGAFPPVLTPNAPPIRRPPFESHHSRKCNSKMKLSDHREPRNEKFAPSDDDVATKLELKTQGSSGCQDASSRERCNEMLSNNGRTEGRCSSKCSSSDSVEKGG